MYRFVGIGSITVIVILSVYFNTSFLGDGQAKDTNTASATQIAPEFVGISGFVDTQNQNQISLASLHGHVVLVHFFRIGCNECIADVGFVNSMFQKYHNFGLAVIGISSPQFEYEKDINQVKQFALQNGIKFPILIDNQRLTFNEYGDLGWPKDAIISADGHIMFTNLGTGNNYNREMAIREALALKNG